MLLVSVRRACMVAQSSGGVRREYQFVDVVVLCVVDIVALADSSECMG